MGASYTYKTYLKSRNSNANTTFYLKVVITETTSAQTNISTNYSYKIILGLDSKYYHYKLNNYIWATWKGSALAGSSTTAYSTPIILGTCQGTSGNPKCNMDGHASGYAGQTEQILYSGSFESTNGSSGVLSVTFEQRVAVPENSSDYDFYSATITQTIRAAKGTFDEGTSKKLKGWCFMPFESSPPLKLWARVYNSSGTVLGTYEIPRTDSRTDVVQVYGTSMCAQSTCGYNYSWDLAALCGRGVLTVKMFYSYDGGTWFQLGSTKTVDTRLDMSVYDGSAWKSGPAYVYNGSEWKPAKRVWVYNGSSWV